MRDRVIQLAFGGDQRRYGEFCDLLRRVLPADTEVVLRGSAITGVRWKDGAPFTPTGPARATSTSRSSATRFTSRNPRRILHSRPPLETAQRQGPRYCARLIPLRERLQQMVGRPVNVQATTDLVMYVRENFMGEPYLTMIERAKNA